MQYDKTKTFWEDSAWCFTLDQYAMQ